MKTAISIPDELFEEAEELAEKLQLSRSQLYVRAISEYTKRHNSQVIREKLDEVYSGAEGDLDASLTIMQSLSLPREKW
jgi:predicted transcriptional regulator